MQECLKLIVMFINTENVSPVFRDENITLQVELGKSYPLLYVLAADDDSPVSYLMSNNTPSGLSVNNETGLVSWVSVPEIDSHSIVFLASDGISTSALVPTIQYCDCKVRKHDSASLVIKSSMIAHYIKALSFYCILDKLNVPF